MPPDLYVGVAGITTRAQADAVLAALPVGFPRRVAIGVLASAKTLAGGERNARSPAPDDIAGIFPSDERAINLVHYFTRTTGDGLASELHAARGVGGHHCHGLQINIAWPDPIELRAFASSTTRCARIVLQLGPAALEAVSFDAEGIADRLVPYMDSGVIDDVLLDASGGVGRPMSLPWISECVAVIREAFPELGITIAGGLSPVCLPERALLASVSIDVESGVRDAFDALHPGKVRAFLDGVYGLLLPGGA